MRPVEALLGANGILAEKPDTQPCFWCCRSGLEHRTAASGLDSGVPALPQLQLHNAGSCRHRCEPQRPCALTQPAAKSQHAAVARARITQGCKKAS